MTVCNHEQKQTSERAHTHLITHNELSSAFRYSTTHLRADYNAAQGLYCIMSRLQVLLATLQSQFALRFTILVCYHSLLSRFDISVCNHGLRNHRRRNIRPPAAMLLLVVLLGFNNSNSQYARRFCRTPTLANMTASASRQGWRATSKGSPTLFVPGVTFNTLHFYDRGTN